MMRNLPNKYTQQMLLEDFHLAEKTPESSMPFQELQEAGFTLQQDLDFFYLPMDICTWVRDQP
eukprot:712265-Amphidinium_carterae.1